MTANGGGLFTSIFPIDSISDNGTPSETSGIPGGYIVST